MLTTADIIAIVNIAVTFLTALGGITLGVISLRFVGRQIRQAADTTKADILLDMIHNFYSDQRVQKILNAIYSNKLNIEIAEGGARSRTTLLSDTGGMEDASLLLDILLAKLQTVGQFYDMGILDRRSLGTWRYEIVAVGRNEHVRRYLTYLVTSYVTNTKIKHNHFGMYKALYLDFEDDLDERKAFQCCLPVSPDITQ